MSEPLPPGKLAHELRNTLAAVDMLLEAAQEGDADAIAKARDAVAEAIDLIAENLEREA